MAEGSTTSATGDDLDVALRDVALHNLRTPLTVAEGAVALLRDHGDRLSDAQRADLFASIVTAHQRIRQMAEAALARPAPDARAQSEPPQVDPRRVVDEVIIDLEDAGSARLLAAVADDVPAAFPGDTTTVRRALENLVTNAMRVSPEGAAVTIATCCTGDGVRFEVTDEGPGIPVERQALLLAGDGHGGRGLAIVRRLVEGRGGELGVRSSPGQGSTFWVTFPLSNA